MGGGPRFWLQLVRVGARSLRVHKLRSALTVLGMVFGVASVVSILAIGEGASYEVQAQLRRLGPDRILMRSVLPPASAGSSSQRIEYGLQQVDLARIEALIPDLQAVAPSYELEKDVHEGGKLVKAPLVCTTPSFREIHQLALSSHMGQPMVGAWDAVGVVACLLLAAGGVALGTWGFARRDLRG